jgi:putative transcriptional regulator
MTAFRIVNRVREKRFFANEMTQQQLADQVGVTRQTIMAIEKGKYSPSLEVAFKIAVVFECDFSEVFSYQLE